MRSQLLKIFLQHKIFACLIWASGIKADDTSVEKVVCCRHVFGHEEQSSKEVEV